MVRPLTALLAVCVLCSGTATARPEREASLPRTEHGFPDLQGYWTNASQTPLQRAPSLGDQRNYGASEVMELVAEARQRVGADVHYTELPGVNHNSWDAAYSDEQIIDWLFGNRL